LNCEDTKRQNFFGQDAVKVATLVNMAEDKKKALRQFTIIIIIIVVIVLVALKLILK